MCYTYVSQLLKIRFVMPLWVILFLKKIFQIAFPPKRALPLHQINSHNYGKMNATYSIKPVNNQKSYNFIIESDLGQK